MTKSFPKNIRKLAFDETGAVSIDYVILLAGMVALAVAGTAAVRSSTADVNAGIGPAAAQTSVATSF